MSIIERVLAAMKTSYQKYGFKREELNQMAAIVAQNLNDESTDEDITNAVTASEGFAHMMQAVYNRGVSETKDKFKGWVKPVEEKPKEEEKPLETGSLTLEQVKTLINEANADRQKAIDNAVKEALMPYLQREEQTRLKTLLQGHEKLKAIPEVFRNNYTLDKEENLDALAAKIETDWATTKQALVSSGQFVEAPPKADPQSETDDFVKMMQGFSERNKPAEPAQ